MKKAVKWICVMTAFALLTLSLVACGKGGETEDNAEDSLEKDNVVSVGDLLG